MHSNARSTCTHGQKTGEREGRRGLMGGRREKPPSVTSQLISRKELGGISPLAGFKFCKSSLLREQKEWAHGQSTQKACWVFWDTWLAGLKLSFHFSHCHQLGIGSGCGARCWAWLVAHNAGLSCKEASRRSTFLPCHFSPPSN